MNTIRDAEDCFMQATANVREWAAEFERMWQSPLSRTVMAAWWQKGVPPAVKDQLKTMSPGAVREVDKQYGG